MLSITIEIQDSPRTLEEQAILEEQARSHRFHDIFLEVFQMISVLDVPGIEALFGLLAENPNFRTINSLVRWPQDCASQQAVVPTESTDFIKTHNRNVFDDVFDEFFLSETSIDNPSGEVIPITQENSISESRTQLLEEPWEICSETHQPSFETYPRAPACDYRESFGIQDPRPDILTSSIKVTSPKPLKRTVKEPVERANGANGVILTILKRCYFTPRNVYLDDQQLREVQIAVDCMFSDDCRQLVLEHIPTWLQQSSSTGHALGLPCLTRTAESAAGLFQFVRLNQLHNKATEIRFAQAAFYLIYLELCRDMKTSARHSISIQMSNSARPSTIARDLILKAIHGVGFEHMSRNRRDLGRRAITNILRWGGRWWKLASCLGLGVLLLASDEVAFRIRDENFLMAQVDGLITYIRSSRPGTLSVFRSIQAETKGLMFGELSTDLINIVQNSEDGPLSESGILTARTKDEITILEQKVANEWRATQTEDIAKETAAGFFFSAP